jgi:O-antigen/teichoic acid export membrane protein
MGGVGVAIISFVQGILVTRTLGPSLYGVLGVVMTFGGLIKAFLSFRTSEPLTRYLVEYKHKNEQSSLEKLLGTAILIDFATRILAFTVIVAAAPLAAQFIAGGEESILIYWIYGATVLGTFLDATWYSVARDLKYFKLLAVLPVIFAALQLLGVVLLWQMALLNLLWLVALYLLIQFGKFMVNGVFLIWKLDTVYKISVLKINWRQCVTQRSDLSGFWTFMNITYLSSMVTTLVKNGDILILGYYRTDEEVGLYRLAKNLVAIIQSVGGTLASVIYQDINELIVLKKYAQIKKGLIKLSKVWLPAILGGLVLAIISAEMVITWVYGSDFAKASIPFSLLMIGVSVAMSLFWVQPMILALNKLKENLLLVSIIGILFTLSSLFVTPIYGSAGMAILLASAWAMGHLGLLWICLKEMRRVGGANEKPS